MAHQNFLQAGFALRDITPPPGTMMGGFGDRTDPAAGVHDPLLCQVMVLNDGVNSLCLVVLDLLTVDQQFTAKIRADVERQTGIPAENIQLVCTHTHGAPMGFRPLAPDSDRSVNQEQIDQLRDQVHQIILDGVLTAHKNKRGVICEAGSKQAPGIATNRLDPEGPMDNTVSTITFRMVEEPRSPLAVLVNFTCHPTVLNYQNLLFTADFPHYVRAYLQEQLPACPQVFFTNGACGDVSTRFTRRGADFKEAQRIGTLVGEAALEGIHSGLPLGKCSINLQQFVIEMPVKELPSLDEARKEYDRTYHAVQSLDRETAGEAQIRLVETEFHGARANLKLVQYGILQNSRAEVNLLSLGDELVMAAIPGEMFVSLGLAVKDASPYPRTIILGYANDAIGYIPSGDAYRGTGYEARRTLFAPGAGEYLVDQVARHLKQLQQGRNV